MKKLVAMKLSLQTTSQIPAWQAERANKLHRACNSVQTRLNHGERKRKAFRRVAKYHNGRAFKCNPKRHLSLSEQTLRRAFAKWKRGGEVPSAFRFRYQPRRPTIPAPVLVRFAGFCASIPMPSVRAAWQKFSARGGAFGRGQHASKPLKISYGQLCYHFPATDFYLMQGELKAIQAAQMKLAQLRFKAIADIRRRLPDRSPRRRVKKELNFQI
jgi:hypothetical protein